MFNNSRRSFVKLAAASTAAISLPSFAFGAVPRVVVIGGGGREHGASGEAASRGVRRLHAARDGSLSEYFRRRSHRGNRLLSHAR